MPRVKAGLTDDALLGGQLILRQPAVGARAGSDAVLLAAAVPAEAGERVLELGCGTGAAMLCLARRVPGTTVVGIEIDPAAAKLAAENAARNGLAERVEVLTGDVGTLPPALRQANFHHVLANPPFFIAGKASPAPQPARARARLAPSSDLDLWLNTAAGALRPRGGLTIICRAERLDDLLAACRRRFGAISLFPLWPGGGKPAKRIILHARKGAKTALRLLPGLVLHNGSSHYTPAAQAVLRHGAALEIG
jgi:tRNA1(Val) A37 N6-methylase TrmN6